MNYYIIVLMSCLLNYKIKIKRYSFLFIFSRGRQPWYRWSFEWHKCSRERHTMCVQFSHVELIRYYHRGIWMTIRSRLCLFLIPMTKISSTYFFKFFFLFCMTKFVQATFNYAFVIISWTEISGWSCKPISLFIVPFLEILRKK